MLGVSLCLLVSCANPIPPTGGPRDTTPPQLIIAESTPNFSVQFDQKEIVLVFDEWVQLKDQATQIVISPPLAYRPQISQVGKTVTVKLHDNEVLRPQTTYTINFGSAIVDLNESTPLDQFKFIFSTGSFIDSLSLSGKVVDASTGKPVEKVLVLLHDHMADTALTRLLPAYFGKTDATGNWRIENIRSDTFRIYALDDQNPNYKYDVTGERIAFDPEPFILTDTSSYAFSLRLFREEPAPLVLDINRRTPGITKLTLNVTDDISARTLETQADELTWAMHLDTLLLWHASPDSVRVEVTSGVPFDTVAIAGFPGTPQPANRFRLEERAIHPGQALVVESMIPLESIRDSAILVTRADTVMITNRLIHIDSSDRRTIRVQSSWQEGAHQLMIPSGAVTDYFGSENDTVRLVFQVNAAGTYGRIYVRVDGLDEDTQYLVQLIQKEPDVIAQFVLDGATQGRDGFPPMQPASYLVRIVEDVNRNGRWDTGNFAQQRQPERVFLQTLEPLRAGWDLEATITWQ